METSGRIPIVFAREWLDADLGSTGGRNVLQALLDSGGIEASELRQTDAVGQDGTHLAGCVKAYLPPPVGSWGAVFTPHRTKSGSDVLIYLAFAERHPSGQRESVYQLAAKRLSLLRSRQR